MYQSGNRTENPSELKIINNKKNGQDHHQSETDSGLVKAESKTQTQDPEFTLKIPKILLKLTKEKLNMSESEETIDNDDTRWTPRIWKQTQIAKLNTNGKYKSKLKKRKKNTECQKRNYSLNSKIN